MRNIIRYLVRWLFAILLIAGYGWLLLWKSVWSVIIISVIFFVAISADCRPKKNTYNSMVPQMKKAS